MLVVEDDLALLESLLEILRLEQIDVVGVSSGQEGLACAQRDRPALILADIVLPDLNGLILGQLLAEDPATRDIPILYISGRDVTVEAVSKMPGACGFLQKPFNVPELLGAIQEALDGHPKA